jgi:hypothetical protein
MRYLIAALALLAFALPSFAVGPQDGTLVFQSRAGGGPVDSYRIYVNDTLVGELAQSGDTFSEIVPGDGTYRVCVNGVNTTAESPAGGCQTIVVGDPPPDPPAPVDVLSIELRCELTDPVTCEVIRP